MRIGIVADDLTGAADAAAPFTRCGLRVGVGYALWGKMGYGPSDVDVLALDTETRETSPEKQTTITRLTRAATRGLRRHGAALIYKKIDSTLRGHLRLELEAVRRELPGRLAILCPAFPANGRTVENGVPHLHGIPWTATEFAPLRPLDAPTVRAAFDSARDPAAAEVRLEIVRQGVAALENALDRLAADGVQTVFCDAVTQSDLETLAQVVLRQPERYLPVGSAGLTAALAVLLPSPDSLTPPAEFPGKTGKVLVAVGSLHSASRRQAAFLAEKASIQPIVAEPEASDERDVDSLNARVCSQFESGQRIVLAMTSGQPSANRHALYALLPSLLWAIGRFPHLCLILTGGATAMDVLHGLVNIIRGVRILGEIQPGVVQGILCGTGTELGKRFDGLPIILKAGGFGTEETLARCVGLVE